MRRQRLASPIEIPLWLLAALVGVVLLLVFLLWSVQRSRKVYLTAAPLADLGDLETSIPSIAGATHGSVHEGNRIEILQNGAFFDRLLEDIAAGRETIHFETFLWEDGEIGRRLGAALAARAREGVEVRVLLDASGSNRAGEETLEAMRRAGARVEIFRPFRPTNAGRLNRRDHRKITVIDGTVGYTGGHCITDAWLGDAEDLRHWRDTSARIEGPVVADLQSAFTENWVEETGEVIAGASYFPRLAPAGDVTAHVAYHFHHGSVSSVEVLLRLAFASARSELLIQNPYLAPDPDVIAELGSAVRRGVDVRVILPAVSDSRLMLHAGHQHYRALLDHGVRLYEYRKALLHQKVVIVDRAWSHIGSTNLDDRSFELNDEVSLGILDQGIAAELRRAFLADLRESTEVQAEAWRRRGSGHGLLDRGAYLFNEVL